jgi:hypothetical protein
MLFVACECGFSSVITLFSVLLARSPARSRGLQFFALTWLGTVLLRAAAWMEDDEAFADLPRLTNLLVAWSSTRTISSLHQPCPGGISCRSR